MDAINRGMYRNEDIVHQLSLDYPKCTFGFVCRLLRARLSCVSTVNNQRRSSEPLCAGGMGREGERDLAYVTIVMQCKLWVVTL